MSGLSFGLNVTKAKKKVGALAKKKRAISVSSAFGSEDGDSSGGEEGVKMTYRERVNKELAVKAEIYQAKMETIQSKVEGGAGTEEGDIYDYDGFAAEKQRREEKHSDFKKAALETGGIKSQYVGNLIASAKIREKERELVHDKRMIKEREREDQLYGDKPKFVTSAYKAKLEEDKKFEAAQAAREAQNDGQIHNVRTFLRNLTHGEGEHSWPGGGTATKEPYPPSLKPEVGLQGEASSKSRGDMKRNRPADVEISHPANIDAVSEPGEEKRSLRARLWNDQLEAARERYFQRKVARQTGGSWDL